MILSACQSHPLAPKAPSPPSPPRPATTLPGAPPAKVPAPGSNGRLIFTYYFYWYDAQSGGHLQPSLLHDHFPATPTPSWRSAEWQRKQLADMSAAGIDVALPVFWGFDRPQDAWSMQGLPVLAQAWHEAQRQGQNPPRLGMFLDTTIDSQRDLTTSGGMDWFYTNVKDFFGQIPRDEWALVGGHPVLFLFTSDFTQAVNQATFDHLYSQFQADFGVRPYVVREVSWNYPFPGWQNGVRMRDFQHPIQTDNSYQWAGALHGYIDSGGVAEVGPGYDERGLPGRKGDFQDRQSGAFYQRNLQAAVRSGKRMIALETWDEMHEATDICESTEYGRTYIDITRRLADQFHALR